MQDYIMKLQLRLVVPRQGLIAHSSSHDVSCHRTRGIAVPTMVDSRYQSRLKIAEVSQDGI